MSLDRPTQPLTYQLANHAKAYLEAQEYVGGYNFLNTLLSTGTSISTPAKRYPAYLAPAPQLALASTLIVYPAITTKSRSAGQPKDSDAALRYLRSVHANVSPTHGSIRSAFAFPDERTRRRTLGYRAGNTSPSSENEVETLSGKVANEDALWYRASDFWHIVGWAFNCSVAHKKRWERWKLWLELKLDFLEAEWEARLRLSKDAGADWQEMLRESLLWHYVSSEDPTNRSNRRRMVRAILAMATAESNAQFPEIWKDETLEAQPVELDTTTLKEIDIDSGKLGEFLGDDEDTIMQEAPHQSTRSSERASAKKRSGGTSDNDGDLPKDNEALMVEDTQGAIRRLGGMGAINLRQRLIALLAQVAQALPVHFTTIGDFFDPFTEELVRLPTAMFSLLISTCKLPGPTQIAFNANLLLPLVTGRLPDYTTIEPSQEHLEEYLLPKRGTNQSYATNAKISLILEQMFMYMMSTETLEATDGLRKAVEKGVEERCSVYGSGKGKKGNAQEEELAKKLMEAGSKRLLGLLEVLEIAAGKPPRPLKKNELLSFVSSGTELSSPPESSTEEDD